MVRVRSNVARHQRVKRKLKRARGYRGSRSKTITSATAAVLRAGAYAYAHRRLKRRMMRRLWVQRINAGARAAGTNYSSLMAALKRSEVALDRKSLAALAVAEPEAFAKLVAQVGLVEQVGGR